MLRPKLFDGAKNGNVKLYAPPMSEFDMLMLELGKNETESVRELHGPSIMIVTKGSGKLKGKGKEHELKEGYIFFVGTDTELDFETEEGLQAFVAYAE